MEFTECVKDRLTLTLKSGLLCAVMLMPATTLAQSLETDRGEETASATDTMTVATVTPEQSGVKLIPADIASAAASAQQRKIARLSGHIQSQYQIPDYKAQQIVAAAIRSGEIHQVEPELILAIIAVESTFKERAVSRVGARGLMQVMPGMNQVCSLSMSRKEVPSRFHSFVLRATVASARSTTARGMRTMLSPVTLQPAAASRASASVPVSKRTPISSSRR